MESSQADRLRAARARFFDTAAEAVQAHGWKLTTYRAHENGQNKLRTDAAKRYARAFKVSWVWLVSGDEGEEPEEVERPFIPIMGYVGAGGDIDPDFEQLPFDGLEQIELPQPVGIVADPIGFRVRGESMMPRYNDGDIAVVEREQPWAIDSMIGDEAVVRTYDGHRYLKRIMPGGKRHTYTLRSVNAEPIEGVRIEWASPVRVIIPNIGLKQHRPRAARLSDNTQAPETKPGRER